MSYPEWFLPEAMDMDSSGKHTAPSRPATNVGKNIRLQPSPTMRRNESLQAHSEDRFDESSSIASLSTTGKVLKCLKCKREALPADPLCACTKCSARYHASCHNPPPPVTGKGKFTTNWRCERCIRKHGLPPKEPVPENGALGSICEMIGCNKISYGKLLCKHHEMVERNEKSKLASKAQVSAFSRSASKPIKKSKLYPVKYDEDMQGMKRKRGRKPGDVKMTQMSPNRPPIQPVVKNKLAAKAQEIAKLERMVTSRGALHPCTDNSVHVPKSPSTAQSQHGTSSPSNTKEAWSVVKIQSQPIPSPSPEYEPPSPARVDYNIKLWVSDIEQNHSPGSQIKDELRAMQQTTGMDAVKSKDAFVQNTSSTISPSHTKTMPGPMFTFTGNKTLAEKRPLNDPEKVVTIPTPTDSSMSSRPAVPSTTEASSSLSSDPVLKKTANVAHFPDLETENLDGACLAKKPKPSPQEYQDAQKKSLEEMGLEHIAEGSLDISMKKLTANRPLEKSPEPEHPGSLIQRSESTSSMELDGPRPTHTAPLYGHYQPHTIEYRRQLRSLTYDPSILDQFLTQQTAFQAKAKIKKEQNLMPQPDIAANTQIWGSIDPRIVWPRELSEEWYEAKRKEIDARCGRKANFGILLTQQVRKERKERGWLPNQNKEFASGDGNGNGAEGSIFVKGGNKDTWEDVELAVRGDVLGVLVPVVGRDGKVKKEKRFVAGGK